MNQILASKVNQPLYTYVRTYLDIIITPENIDLLSIRFAKDGLSFLFVFRH